MNKFSPLLLSAMLAAAPTLPASAQVPLFRWDNPNESGPFNSTQAFYRQLSDVDGDGFPEILFPDRSAQPEVVLWIWSLARNQLLFTVPTSNVDLFTFPEWVISMKDLNGDGFRDFAVNFRDRFPNPPTIRWVIRVHSGLDGTLLWETNETLLGFPAPSALFNLGDITGDGIEDIGAENSSNQALILSGLDGTPSTLISTNDPFGLDTLHPAGDIDGDGFGDIINDAGGDIRFFSGRTGQVILLLPRDLPDGRERDFVVGVGDVDADGRDDWAEGWRGDFLGHPSPTCIIPCIAFFSGLPPQRIGLVEGREFPDKLWSGPYFHFDFDGDGAQDIAYRGSWSNSLTDCSPGSWHEFPYYFSIYSPARDRTLRVWSHGSLELQSLDADWDGDSFPDLLALKYEGEGVIVKTLQVLTTGIHIKVSPSSLSKSTGGMLTFQIHGNQRFANRKVFLIPGNGPEWPFHLVSFSTSGGVAFTKLFRV